MILKILKLPMRFPEKKYEIKFKKEWTAKFAWLQEDTSSRQGKKCTVCGVGINGNQNHIERHARTEMHKKNELSAKSTPKIVNFCKADSEETKSNVAAQELEIRLSLFIAEHNLPFNCLDHLTKCLKTVKDSKTISKLSLNRLKGQNIITSASGPENVNNLVEFTKTHYYSIIIDESTDLTTSQNLAVVIRIFNQKCQDRFLDLIPVIDKSAAGIFDVLIKHLNDRKIPLKNLLGFVADNCNVMMGKNNSVQTRLKKICPNLFVNGDVCHNLNLASEAAASELPKTVDDLMVEINAHFCHSSSRKADFIEMQQDFGDEVHTILRFCKTRWLSREVNIKFT